MKTPKSSELNQSFSRWKIWAGIGIGLLVSLSLVYTAWNEVHYIEVSAGTGTHEWIDSNQDGHIQSDIDLFREQPNGSFRQQTAQETLKSIEWNSHLIGWIFVGILGVIARDFFYILRIRHLTHKQLGWRSAFDTIMLWEFSSALAPGVMSGSAIAMFILNKEKIALGRATAIVFSTTFLDNLFYVLMVPLVVFGFQQAELVPNGTVSAAVEGLFWFAYFLFSSVALFFFVLLFVRPSFGKRVFETLAQIKWLSRWKLQLIQIGEDSMNASLVLKKERIGFWISAFFYTCASWLSRYFVINVLIHAFVPVNVSEHLSIFSKQLVLWLTMRVSPTPGGSGVAEYAFTTLMGDVGTSLVLITLIALIWRMLSYFPYLIVGSLLLPVWLKKTQKKH